MGRYSEVISAGKETVVLKISALWLNSHSKLGIFDINGNRFSCLLTCVVLDRMTTCLENLKMSRLETGQKSG